MNSLTVRVIGLDSLNAKFKQIPVDVARKVLRKGPGAAAQLIKRAARPFIHNRTGTLSRSLISKFLREESNDTQAVYIVTARKGKKLQKGQKVGKGIRKTNLDAYYASWVEFGHKIVPRRGKAEPFSKRKRGVVGRGTLRARRAAATGFVAGRRFLTPALANNTNQAIEAMKTAIAREFDRVIR
jgi:HK97 gp10 family phage protein